MMPFPAGAPRKIRDKMDVGELPRDAPGRMYAGFGNGKFCHGCETPILSAQIVYQFEASDRRVVRFHLGCASLWEAYRRPVELNPR
jgi:hypothetical protein